MSVEISADTAVVMNFKGQYLAVNVDFILHQGMCSKQGPTLASSACISGFVLSDKEQN